ncbi:MAG: Imm27 family immunity protein [bacterium]
MPHEYPDLQADEQQLTGHWKDGKAGAAADDVDERILWLVTKRLLPKGLTADGWDSLFLDPRDSRFWELTFPQSSLFGGGPRQLSVLSPEAAAEKYGMSAID